MIYEPQNKIEVSTPKGTGIIWLVTEYGHETMHMSILLNNWDIKDKEEEVITFAEEEANKIIEKLKNTKVEQPKKKFFSRK